MGKTGEQLSLATHIRTEECHAGCFFLSTCMLASRWGPAWTQWSLEECHHYGQIREM